VQEAEKKDFWKLVHQMLLAYQQKPNDFIMGVWWSACKEYDFKRVQWAIEQWCANPKTGKWAPKPADVAAVLQQEGEHQPIRRLGANEAWALALTSHDEEKTVVWTDEIAQAWHAAQPALDKRSKAAARMAFLEAYARITSANDAAGRCPKIAASYGWNAALRADAFKTPTAQTLLAMCGVSETELLAISLDAHVLQSPQGLPPKIRLWLDELKEKWRMEDAQKEQQRHKQLQQERAEWDDKKRLALQQMRDFLRKKEVREAKLRKAHRMEYAAYYAQTD